jgi:hypothetical protein
VGYLPQIDLTMIHFLTQISVTVHLAYPAILCTVTRNTVLVDAKTTRDADAAELAALYQRAEDKGKAFAAHMEASMALWQAVSEARAARDAFKRDFRAKNMGLKITNKETTNDQQS